jgi:hypothetical protein
MKMKFLALSVVVAFGGVAGTAQAALSVSGTGVGHSLILPYYTTQAAQHTLLSIVNTDQTNGKAVKVRFRGALDSDDVLDFQVFLSPNDVWTADVGPVGGGKVALRTPDNSCTLPAAVGKDWTDNVPGGKSLFRDARLKATDPVGVSEGYVEIFNMADIPPFENAVDGGGVSTGVQTTTPNALFTAIKHVRDASGNMVAPCPPATTTTGVLGRIHEDNAASFNAALDGSDASQSTIQLDKPTATLFGNWAIVNTNDQSAYSAWMTTLVASDATRLVYSPQDPVKDVPASVAATSFAAGISSTADFVLLNSAAYDVSSKTIDYPDMSTPYEQTTTSADAQARALSNAIIRSSTTGEFMSADVAGVAMATDWVFSQPTRRYHVAGRGGKYGAATLASSGPTLPYSNSFVTYAADGIGACVEVGGYTIHDQNERDVIVAGGEIDVSPVPRGKVSKLALCNETGVVSLNNKDAAATGVLRSKYWPDSAVGAGTAGAVNTNFGEGFNTFGWATLNLKAASNPYGLPLLGQQFSKAVAGSANGGYGINYDHRFTPGTPVPDSAPF